MQVFIMRYGEALLDATSDAVRLVTLCARDHSRLIVAWLNTKSVDIEQVLVSLYLQAKQILAMLRGMT